MLIVPTYLDKSAIHGFGVYAKVFIPKGTKAWSFHPIFDIRISPDEFAKLPRSSQEEIEIHMYEPEAGGNLYYETTMGKYMNHSREPNVDFSVVYEGWTTRDIQAGEELNCDYRNFMADVSGIPYI
ncbi:MAG: SET domain-containing protein [Thiohalobacteraceae bacterium]